MQRQSSDFQSRMQFLHAEFQSYLQRKLREIRVNRHLYETYREIYSTQLKMLCGKTL